MKSIDSSLKGWVSSGSDLSLLYGLCLSAAVPWHTRHSLIYYLTSFYMLVQ
jgi:hypothetical protein